MSPVIRAQVLPQGMSPVLNQLLEHSIGLISAKIKPTAPNLTGLEKKKKKNMSNMAENDTQNARKSLDTVDHIAVAVDDVGKAVDWYCKTFKCNIEYQDKTWAFLCFENIKLALVVPNQHPPHIAFCMKTQTSLAT